MPARPDILNLSKTQKYLLLTALYFAQGVPFGLFAQALPVILRQSDTPLELIGLSSLLALPWALKFLWSPWVDQPLGTLPRRKGWLLPILLFTVLALALLGTIDPWQDLKLLMAGVLIMNFLNATQDIATDGLAVDVLEVSERGIGNGIQVGGYRLGMLFGGAAVLVLIERLGWSQGLLVAACGVLLTILPLLWVRETSTRTTEEIEHVGFKTLWSFIRAPGIGRVVGVIIAFKLGDALGGSMIRPMLVDQGFTMGEIGEISGGIGFSAALVGTIIGAVVTDRLPRRVALVVGAAFQTVGALIYILVLVHSSSYAMVAGVIAIENILGSVATVMLFACMMDWSRSTHSGSDYTTLASIVVLAQGRGFGLERLLGQRSWLRRAPPARGRHRARRRNPGRTMVSSARSRAPRTTSRRTPRVTADRAVALAFSLEITHQERDLASFQTCAPWTKHAKLSFGFSAPLVAAKRSINI